MPEFDAGILHTTLFYSMYSCLYAGQMIPELQEKELLQEQCMERTHVHVCALAVDMHKHVDIAGGARRTSAANWPRGH